MVTVNFYSLVGCEPAEGTVIMSGLYGVQDGGGEEGETTFDEKHQTKNYSFHFDCNLNRIKPGHQILFAHCFKLHHIAG